MMKPAGLLFTLLPLLAAGCAVGPDHPPATTLPLPPDRLPPSVPDKWWTLYADAGLNQAVQQALTSNRDLRAAAANLQAARAVLGEADAARLPVTTFATRAGYGSTADDQLEAALEQSDTIRTGPRYGIGMDVQWEIDLFGRLRALSRAADADTQAMQAAEDGVRVEVAAETTRAWLDACSYAQQLAIAQRSLRLAQQEQQATRALYLAGAGTQPAALRAQNQADLAATSLPPLQAARRRALAELAVLTGRLPDNPPQAALKCSAPPSLAAVRLPESQGATLLSRRPDVRQAQQALSAATARIGVATADLYPRIAFGASAFSSAHRPDGWDDSGATVWSLGPLISWSFPNISAQRARIAQADAREQAALAHFDAALLNALKEMRQNMSDYHAALQQRAMLQQAADDSGRALTLAGLARQEGAATALEYLDAQRADLAMRDRLARADGRIIAAQVALFKSLGGGWQQAPSVPLPPRRPAQA